MSPRKVTPMKMHNFYCPDELWAEMQKNAISLNEFDSEFVRTAIEFRLSFIDDGKKFEESIRKAATKPTIPELKAKVNGKPSMVKSFMKGGK